MVQTINRVCRDLSNWGRKCGLTLNAIKTVVILFSKTNIEKKKYNKNPEKFYCLFGAQYLYSMFTNG